MSYNRKDIPNLADEYVLGLVETATLAEIEKASANDPELTAAIEASRKRFLPLDGTATPVKVSDTLWEQIESALPAPATARPVSTLENANDNSTRWKKAAISSIAAALVLAVGLGYSLMRDVQPLVVAVLISETGEIQAVVEDFGNEQATIRMLADLTVPQDKTIEVWTLPSKDVGPVSLGLLKGVRSARLDGPSLPAPRDNQLYEITLEQAGGSPSGRPSGPILAKGFARLPR